MKNRQNCIFFLKTVFLKDIKVFLSLKSKLAKKYISINDHKRVAFNYNVMNNSNSFIRCYPKSVMYTCNEYMYVHTK